MTIRILTALFFCAILFFPLQATASNLTQTNKDEILVSGNFDDMRKTGASTVIEVINPLVLKLDDGRYIHLAGLDYPDLDYHNPGSLSVTALRILGDFLKNKKVYIYQTPSPKIGRKNRLNHNIAHIVQVESNTWVQGMLLSLGVARTRSTQNNPEMTKQMLRLEDKARKNKNGMWEIPNYSVLTPEGAKKHIGSYQIVEGTIQSAAMHKNRLYLNFGKNWRDDFTVSISAFDLKKFTRQKIYPKDWNGKHVRVRGWIESYNGPYMKIDHPERFEALFEQNENKKTPASNTTDAKQKKQTRDITEKGTALPAYNN